MKTLIYLVFATAFFACKKQSDPIDNKLPKGTYFDMLVFSSSSNIHVKIENTTTGKVVREFYSSSLSEHSKYFSGANWTTENKDSYKLTYESHDKVPVVSSMTVHISGTKQPYYHYFNGNNSQVNDTLYKSAQEFKIN